MTDLFCSLTDVGWRQLRTSLDWISGEYLFRSSIFLLVVGGFWLGLWLLFLFHQRSNDFWRREFVDRLVPFLRTHEWRIVAILVCLSSLGSAILAVFVLGATPHVPDEVAYLFTAKALASGQCWLPAPPDGLEKAFEVPFLLTEHGRWYGKYPPTWPAVLALGERFGVAWLVNPILDALALLLFHRLARQWMGATRALLGTSLLASSPFFVIMGASLMSHPLTLVLHLCGLIAWTRLRRKDNSALSEIVLGASFGATLALRPMDAVALWAVPVAWLLSSRWQDGRLEVRSVARLLTSSLICPLLALAYNVNVTGEVSLSLYARYDPTDRLGFGPNVGWGGHNLFNGICGLVFNGFVLNEDLFGWPLSSLLLVGLGMLSVGRRGDDRRVAIWGISLLAVGYCLYFGHGIAYGARYYHALLPFLVILTIDGIDFVASLGGRSALPATLLTVLFLAVLSVATYWPGRFEALQDYLLVASTPQSRIPPGSSRRLFVIGSSKPGEVEKYWGPFFWNPIGSGAKKDTKRPLVSGAVKPAEDGPLFIRDGPWVRDGRVSRAFPGYQIVPLDLAPFRLRSW